MGLPELEPGTSSLSGIEGRRDAFLATLFPAVQASHAGSRLVAHSTTVRSGDAWPQVHDRPPPPDRLGEQALPASSASLPGSPRNPSPSGSVAFGAAAGPGRSHAARRGLPAAPGGTSGSAEPAGRRHPAPSPPPAAAGPCNAPAPAQAASSAASAAASTIALLAPLPQVGAMAWAASPTNTSRPSAHRRQSTRTTWLTSSPSRLPSRSSTGAASGSADAHRRRTRPGPVRPGPERPVGRSHPGTGRCCHRPAGPRPTAQAGSSTPPRRARTRRRAPAHARSGPRSLGPPRQSRHRRARSRPPRPPHHQIRGALGLHPLVAGPHRAVGRRQVTLVPSWTAMAGWAWTAASRTPYRWLRRSTRAWSSPWSKSGSGSSSRTEPVGSRMAAGGVRQAARCSFAPSPRA
jgi:hypothetical protein